MLAYGTNTFTSHELLTSGIPITIIDYGLIVLFSATYWQWLNLLLKIKTAKNKSRLFLVFLYVVITYKYCSIVKESV